MSVLQRLPAARRPVRRPAAVGLRSRLGDESDLRRFLVEHPYEFFAGVNPDFFACTTIDR